MIPSPLTCESSFDFVLQVNVFLGPQCDYCTAIVARQAPYWNIPVITPGALSYYFGAEKFKIMSTLTRVGSTFQAFFHALLTVSICNLYGIKGAGWPSG